MKFVQAPPESFDLPDEVEEDIYYSNQGQTGSCVRHALAKAVKRAINLHTHGSVNIPVNNLINMLLTNRADLGGQGAEPEDWDGKKGCVHCTRNYIYQIQLHVERTLDVENADVICVDLHDVLPKWKKDSWHALFSYETVGDLIHLKNSWGTNHTLIKLNREWFRKNETNMYRVTLSALVFNNSECSRWFPVVYSSIACYYGYHPEYSLHTLSGGTLVGDSHMIGRSTVFSFDRSIPDLEVKIRSNLLGPGFPLTLRFQYAGQMCYTFEVADTSLLGTGSLGFLAMTDGKLVCQAANKCNGNHLFLPHPQYDGTYLIILPGFGSALTVSKDNSIVAAPVSHHNSQKFCFTAKYEFE